MDMMAEKRVDPKPVRKGIPLPVKRRMIVLFAQFQTVGQVHKAIAAEFGLALDHRTIQAYDAGRDDARIGKALKVLYKTHRAAYIGETAAHGVAHQTHRLMLIEKLIDKATTSRDYASALKGLELAAKEMGGVLTNTQHVKHEGKIAHDHRHLSIDDARAELAMRLHGVIEGGTLPLAAPTHEPIVIQADAIDVTPPTPPA